MYSNRLLAWLAALSLGTSVQFLEIGGAVAQEVEAPPKASAPPANSTEVDPSEEGSPKGQGVPENGKQPAIEPAKESPAGEPNARVAPEAAATTQVEENPASPPRPLVEWDQEIEAVTQKKSPEGLDDLRKIQNQVRKVVAFARPATVGVQVGGAVGSAVIVSEDGLVLTAGHVAMEPNKPVVFFFADGRRARGITLGVNRAVDSGMMKITDEGPWPFAPIAPAGGIKPGDWVVGLGQPNGFFKDRAPPVRLGRVLYGDNTTLCTDVTLVGGDSGGPLFNLKGEVVGIHSRIGRRIVSNFHVPIDQYHTTWDRLVAGQIWGGSLGADEPDQYRALLGLAGNSLNDRCEITQVYRGMPASSAGFKPGDVVTRFGDDEVSSFEDLAQLVLAQKPGNRIKVQVERNGENVTLEVMLGRIQLGFPGEPPAESPS